MPCSHVILPGDIAARVPQDRLMSETEWRSLGVQQSRGWEHYMIHRPGKRGLLVVSQNSLNATFLIRVAHTLVSVKQSPIFYCSAVPRSCPHRSPQASVQYDLPVDSSRRRENKTPRSIVQCVLRHFACFRSKLRLSRERTLEFSILTAKRPRLRQFNNRKTTAARVKMDKTS
jgi:hypothetical protein